MNLYIHTYIYIYLYPSGSFKKVWCAYLFNLYIHSAIPNEITISFQVCVVDSGLVFLGQKHSFGSQLPVEQYFDRLHEIRRVKVNM